MDCLLVLAQDHPNNSLIQNIMVYRAPLVWFLHEEQHRGVNVICGRRDQFYGHVGLPLLLPLVSGNILFLIF